MCSCFIFEVYSIVTWVSFANGGKKWLNVVESGAVGAVLIGKTPMFFLCKTRYVVKERKRLMAGVKGLEIYYNFYICIFEYCSKEHYFFYSKSQWTLGGGINVGL